MHWNHNGGLDQANHLSCHRGIKRPTSTHGNQGNINGAKLFDLSLRGHSRHTSKMGNGETIEIEDKERFMHFAVFLLIFRYPANTRNKHSANLKFAGTINYPSSHFHSLDEIVSRRVVADRYDVCLKVSLRKPDCRIVRVCYDADLAAFRDPETRQSIPGNLHSTSPAIVEGLYTIA